MYSWRGGEELVQCTVREGGEELVYSWRGKVELVYS